jgi:hypothetical protein
MIESVGMYVHDVYQAPQTRGPREGSMRPSNSFSKQETMIS